MTASLFPFHKVQRGVWQSPWTLGVCALLLLLLLSPWVRRHLVSGADWREGFAGAGGSAASRTRSEWLDGPARYDAWYAAHADALALGAHPSLPADMARVLRFDAPIDGAVSVVVDLGCGNGRWLRALESALLHDVPGARATDDDGGGAQWGRTALVGVDRSAAMIAEARRAPTQPPPSSSAPSISSSSRRRDSIEWLQGDALDARLLPRGSVTHLLCTNYAFQELSASAPDAAEQFLRNAYDWLVPGGFLVLHLVDRAPDTARWRMQHVGADFRYSARWDADAETLRETIEWPRTRRVRRQHAQLRFRRLQDETALVQDAGFLLHAQYSVASPREFIVLFRKDAYH